MSGSQSTDSQARYVVGIDLGTTNSAVAFVDTHEHDGRVQVFRVPQFVGPGEIEARETLPSFHYTSAPGEFSGIRLPWQSADASYFVGFFARDHGASVPGRLVVSAKSWLSHSGVDRTAALLPWHGALDVERLSPSEVSSRYLGLIRAAWNHHWPEHPLERQDVVVTIPASFDEVARELTVEAARRAGLPRLVLLEEPQAAFYAWINAQGGRWSEQLQAGQRILVCDVGGGTTDFTLIQVQPGERGEVKFHRFAVGEHLILGGDNLDLALAHFLEDRLTHGGKLEPRPWSVLVRRCQEAKETLLGPNPPARTTVSIPAGGSRVIGGARQVEITRDEARDMLVDGFLPRVNIGEEPALRGSGFQEFGLPYAPDHAITRYLAAFLRTHAGGGTPAGARAGDGSAAVRPDILLLNGGLFESPDMRERLLEVLRSWFADGNKPDGWQPLVLKNQRLDLAVAFGAAYYGLVRRGRGVRISGGLARSYYLGIAQRDSTSALCLVPAGLEEGHEVELANREFELLIRQPVEFPLFVSSARTNDQPGDLVKLDETQLSALPPIRTVLQAGRKNAPSETISVRLHARLTEIGTLEVWCGEADGKRRWRLQFDVRAATQTESKGHTGEGERAGFVDEDAAARCLECLRRTFLPAKAPLSPERLVKEMEEELSLPRQDWLPSLLRRLWEELIGLEEGRARSLLHEARWLNLLGFALRPGFGFAVDDWRVAQTWQLFAKKVHNAGNELCRAEWLILWRRVAGGLVPAQQRLLAEPLVSALRAVERAEKSGPSGASPKAAANALFRYGPHETQEAWRLLGSLELLTTDLKIELGDRLLAILNVKGANALGGAALWALGRIGGRVPMYGPLNTIVPVEAVERWIEQLITTPGDGDSRIFPMVQMARRTGDRYRDVSEQPRERVLAWLSTHGALDHYVELVRSGGELRRDEQSLVFGESLPAGLRLA